MGRQIWQSRGVSGIGDLTKNPSDPAPNKTTTLPGAPQTIKNHVFPSKRHVFVDEHLFHGFEGPW